MQLEFDFMCPERKQETQGQASERDKLKKFEGYINLTEPPKSIKNDNDRLRVLEWEFYKGDKLALSSMYSLLFKLALKIIRKEMDRKKFFLDLDEIESKAENASTYIIEQYLTRVGFQMVLPTSYLYLRVKHELYYKTKIKDLIQYASTEELKQLITEQQERG